MAIDSTLPARRAIMAAMKSDAALTAIVPAAQQYPMTATNPVWPFTLYGSPTPVPIRATCLDGSEITVAIHGFAKPRYVGGAMVETAEDHAGRIGAAIARALDGQNLEIPQGRAKVRWTGSQLLVDGAEADAFHCVVNLRVRCVTG
ncbi:hypothetical protein ABIC65_001091 [Sphingomonas trueperi]|uniref:DUF3168 domain-containing protein n=1 Tax=Sphingomonas trueperi TaxID=53317 RepID=UPI00339A9D52